jgi:hypothetical protein
MRVAGDGEALCFLPEYALHVAQRGFFGRSQLSDKWKFGADFADVRNSADFLQTRKLKWFGLPREVVVDGTFRRMLRRI